MRCDRALLAAPREGLDEHEREHVIPYFFRCRATLHLEFLDCGASDAEFSQRFSIDSIDTADDLLHASETAHILGSEGFGWHDVLRAAEEVRRAATTG